MQNLKSGSPLVSRLAPTSISRMAVSATAPLPSKMIWRPGISSRLIFTWAMVGVQGAFTYIAAAILWE
jgi:hypothetical protein